MGSGLIGLSQSDHHLWGKICIGPFRASKTVDYLPLVGGTLLVVSWTGFAIMSSSWHMIDTDGGQCSESAWLEGLCATSIDVISMSASPGPPPPPGSGGISVP